MTRRELRLAGIAGSTLIIVCLFFAWSISTRDEALEVGTDFCPVDRREQPEYAIVLLDVSEPLIGGNAIELKRRIANVGDNLKRYGRLEVFNVHDMSQAIVSICRPQKVEECDPKTAPRACRGVKESYQRNFTDRIVTDLAEFLVRQREQSTSPLLEAIKDVSTLTDFGNEFSGSKYLYVVSDMLQHTPGVYSHYGRVVGRDEFTELAKHRFYADHQPDLNGVGVKIFYVLRRKYRSLQTDFHKAFWREYFQSTNAKQMELMEINFVGGDISKGSDYGDVMNPGSFRKRTVYSRPPESIIEEPLDELPKRVD